MRLALCMCALVLAAALLQPADGKKVFTSRRKSGGSNKNNNNHRRGGTSQKNPAAPAPAPATPGRTDSTNSQFLAAERGVSSQGSTNVHNRELGLFHRKPASAPEPPKQSVPHTNGPIGFDKVNSEVQRKSSPPAYPGGTAGAHGSAPNGPPPAYNPGYNTPGTGSHDAPPAYPGRPVNAPPVYPGSYGQRAPGQPGSGYPNQQAGYQQSGYPHQAGYPSQSYAGQQNFGHPNTGYPNTGSNFGYPNQGIGPYPGGGFGNSYQGGFGGNPYGGSPFGHSNSFGGNSFGNGNNHYGANNFGFSNSPGLFGGSHSSGFGGFGGGLSGGGYNNNFGYHKKSRFGGLPIPIPIPIPIPMGLFGGWGGGHSRSHREMDAFLRNQAVNSSSNETTNVYILNNSTVTPCTTDQFIYGTLNVTVISCTAGNCTAIKLFVTTNTSGELTSRTAGLTMCLESNTTFSSFAENTNPLVSDLHRYWMKMCKELVWSNAAGNATGNVTENASGNVIKYTSENGSEPVANVTVKVSEIVLNETLIKIDNTVEQLPLSTTPASLENSTVSSVSSEESVNFEFNSTEDNPIKPIKSFCETFDCSWIEMCLPAVEVVEPCSPPGCNSTKMTHNPCVRIKMCRSPTTPISTFATFNNSITRTDPTGDVMQANDVANLTLISYIHPSLSANCSEDSGDASCKPLPSASQEVYASTNSSDVSGESLTSNASAHYVTPDVISTSSVETTSIDQSSTPTPS